MTDIYDRMALHLYLLPEDEPMNPVRGAAYLREKIAKTHIPIEEYTRLRAQVAEFIHGETGGEPYPPKEES
jgi:hypothetical protein